MTACPINRAYPELFTLAEVERLTELLQPPEEHRRRTRIIRAHETLHSSLYLVRGMMGRYEIDRFGRRQFTALQLPGDYADLPAFPLKSMDHDIDAMGDVTVQHTPHSGLVDILEEWPDLTRKLWRISLIDASIHRYWIFRVGRLNGKARVANFFAEMFLRLFARGLATVDGFDLPLSQTDLAEICGMTPVHLNRLLSELRLDGVCIFTAGKLQILDLQKLFRVGEHTRAYLYLPDSVEAEVSKLLGD